MLSRILLLKVTILCTLIRSKLHSVLWVLLLSKLAQNYLTSGIYFQRIRTASGSSSGFLRQRNKHVFLAHGSTSSSGHSLRECESTQETSSKFLQRKGRSVLARRRSTNAPVPATGTLLTWRGCQARDAFSSSSRDTSGHSRHGSIRPVGVLKVPSAARPIDCRVEEGVDPPGLGRFLWARLKGWLCSHPASSWRRCYLLPNQPSETSREPFPPVGRYGGCCGETVPGRVRQERPGFVQEMRGQHRQGLAAPGHHGAGMVGAGRGLPLHAPS